MKSRVSVVVVNYNGGSLLNDCLRSLRDQTYPIERIFVMDNGSSDGSLASSDTYPNLEKVALGFNYGFAEGNNLAFERCETEFVALLNPDAVADPRWIQELVEAAEAHPEAGAFGSRQMQHGSESILDGTGDVYHASGLVWRRRYGKPVSPGDLQAGSVFSACGGAAFYRTAAIKAVGGFDRRFFCYVEDVDLGFRLQLAGWPCRYVPSALVHHVGGASTGGARSDFSLYHGHRNVVWTFVKNMPGLLFWLLLPAHVAMNIVTLIVFAARGYGRIIVKAKYDAVRGLPEVIRSRKAVQAGRRAGVLEIWKRLDFSPFAARANHRKLVPALLQEVCRRLHRR